jgi:predicted transcriptional regulator
VKAVIPSHLYQALAPVSLKLLKTLPSPLVSRRWSLVQLKQLSSQLKQISSHLKQLLVPLKQLSSQLKQLSSPLKSPLQRTR